MENPGIGPLHLFISYAHEDEELLQEFVKNLIQLKREQQIQDWHDRQISAGSDWKGKIDEHLKSADIIVLLVSPDFLASAYCYDIEVMSALERHQAGEARVVPVILRPSDWKTSPFGKLMALPKGAKPVVDWPTQDPKLHDHAFLDVVEGLRRVAREIQEAAQRGAPATPHGLVDQRLLRKVWLWLALVGVLIVLIIAVKWFWWTMQRREQERQYVAQGDASLDVGRYEQASEPYQQALRASPGNQAARIGLKVVELAKLRPDAVTFEQRLHQLIKEAPKDPHLKVLEGDYFVGLGKLDAAMSRYEDAANLDHGLAEAYFRMGVLYDQRRDLARASPMYKHAVELAPSSPQYACNLAAQYFKHGEYQEAIRVYGGIRQFPLAALESARIYRLLGELKAANEQERNAIEWMKEPAVANSVEGRLPWWFEYGGPQPVSLSSEGEKFCYAHLELSATLYLDGDAAHAKNESDSADRHCGARLRAVQAIVRWELDRVAKERKEMAGREASYRQRFLDE